MKSVNQLVLDTDNVLLLNKLIASVVQFSLSSTSDPESISKMFATAIRQAVTRTTKYPNTSKHTDHLTRVFHEWSSNPDYLDAEGIPMALAINGPKRSISSLIKKANGTNDNRKLAAILKSDTLQRAARGKWMMRKTYFDCKHNEQLYRHHACLTALRFFQTVNKNVLRKPSLFERTAAISDLHRTAQKDFRDFSEMHCEGLIKTVNRWLENNRERPKVGRRTKLRKIEAGVHVFTFVN